MLPSPKRMKFLQDNENQQGERIINSFPEISAQPINDRNDDVQLDLKHLAPISLEAELYKWPEPNRLPIYKKVNKNFRGEITKVKKRVFSNYYKLNQNGHFVWTNQLVINGEIDLNFQRTDDVFKLNNFKANVCDLENPENSFYLQRVENIGLGLFAKHDIPRGECVGEYTGELISSNEEDLRNEMYGRRKLSSYIYNTCAENLVIDAGAMGNHTRFINHSCEPNILAANTIVRGVPRVLMVATEPIERGEQLYLNYTRSYFGGLRCMCNTSSCFMPSIDERNETDPNNSWLEEYNRRQAIVVDRSQAVVEDDIDNFQGQAHLRNLQNNRKTIFAANFFRSPKNELLRRQLSYSYKQKLKGGNELLEMFDACRNLNESQSTDIEDWEEDE